MINLMQLINDISILDAACLVTIDVECLYNSIPHDKEVAVVPTLLDYMGSEFTQFNEFIVHLFTFILTRNASVINGSHYLQVQAVAMGQFSPCHLQPCSRGMGTRTIHK